MQILTLNAGSLVIAQKEAAASALGLTVSENGLIVATNTTAASSSFKGLAASIGISTSALGIATGIIAAIATVSILYKQYQRSQEESRKQADSAATTYNETASSISDYAAHYKELHTALLAAEGDEAKVYAIKKQLLELQNELNQKYGEEYGRINLVTAAYTDQTKAILGYNKAAAEQYLNENGIEIEKAKKKMITPKARKLSTLSIYGANNHQKELEAIVEKYKERGITSDYASLFPFSHSLELYKAAPLIRLTVLQRHWTLWKDR